MARSSRFALLGVLALVAVACAEPPAGSTQLATPDATGYVQPRISSDGSTVLSRREADRNLEFAVPADLVRTVVGNPVPQVVPNIGNLQAVSPNGRFVVHSVRKSSASYETESYVRDLQLGTQVLLPERPATRESVAIAQSGGVVTVAWNAVQYQAGNCPCLRRLRVWKAPEMSLSSGTFSVDTALDAVPWEYWDGGDYGDFVGLTSDGKFAFVQNWRSRTIEKFDTTTRAKSVVPLQYPAYVPIFTDSQSEWVNFSSADGSTFRMDVGGPAEEVLLRVGLPPVLNAPKGVLSADGRWGLELVTTPGPRIGGQTVSLVRTEIATGARTTIVSGEEAINNVDYFKFFNVSDPLAIANSGKVAFGFWRAPLFTEGEWPASQLFITG